MFVSHTANKHKPNLLTRVRAAITCHALITRGDKVIVGVSGGPDSLALLHVLCALRNDLQFTLHVAHLNHQLRGDASQADADFVASIARAWHLEATIESRDVNALAQADHLSIEEAARHARYAFLAEVAQKQGASVVAVAHHRDDQVETVLMHWLRGSGLAGLRGINPKSQFPISNFQFPISNLQLIRPLLDITRTEIEQYIQANGLTPRQDQSNFDTTLFRNRLRHEVLPYLESLNPNLRDVLYHSVQSIADDYDFLNAAVETAFAQVAREDAERGAIIFSREAWRALHPALQRGTLRAAVHCMRGNLRDLGWAHVEGARRIALEKSAGAQATLPNGLILIVGYDDFTITNAERGAPLPDLPLLHVDEIVVSLEGITPLPDSDWVIETRVVNERAEATNRWTATFDVDKVRGDLRLRRRRDGDRFQPIGMSGHSRSVHEFMIDEKIPRATRDWLPILVVDDRIVWVCGWRIDARARVTESTKKIWQVTFHK